MANTPKMGTFRTSDRAVAVAFVTSLRGLGRPFSVGCPGGEWEVTFPQNDGSDPPPSAESGVTIDLLASR